MKMNPIHLTNFLFFLSILHTVAGFPSELFRRQAPGESITDVIPDWFWYGVNGLGTAAGTINGWVNDLIFPDSPASDPVASPGTTTLDGNSWQDNRGPDIELERIVAPVKNFGDDCKPTALPGEQGTLVG